jgi:uncharacterized protein YndB with AHSA1/START domain
MTDTDIAKFKPKTVYVTYIAATPEQVWQALTDPAFTRQYFAGFSIDIEPHTGGAFRLLYPDGRVHMSGRVMDWSPPEHLSCTWWIEGMPNFRDLPECLVTYDIEPASGAVKLTMTESHSWQVPDDVLAGGRSGWPAILSSLKSMLENGRPLDIKQEPPLGLFEAVRNVVAIKPWLKS